MARAKKGQIAALKIKTATVYIGGDDLLIHRFSSKALYEMIGKQMQLATSGSEARDPQFEYIRSLYYLSGNRFGFPSRAFKSCLVRGADITGIMKMTAAKGCVFVKGETVRSALGSDRMLEIVGVPTFHAAPVRAGGSAALRFRGEFQEWAVALPIEFNESMVSLEQIVQMLEAGGYGCGLAEDRPGRGGERGKFHHIQKQEYDALVKRTSKEREAWFKKNVESIARIDGEDKRLIDLLLNPTAQAALDKVLRDAGKRPNGKPRIKNGDFNEVTA